MVMLLVLSSKFNKTLVITNLFRFKRLYEKKQNKKVNISYGFYH